ncbi:MAG: hypothetical protein ACC608_01335 [Anaerofustis sp.]
MKGNVARKREDAISKLIGDETLLWRGRPVWKCFYKQEAQEIIFSFCWLLFMCFFIMMAVPDVWARIYMMTLPALWFGCRMSAWSYRKINTVFLLTDRRAVMIYRKDGNWLEISKPYEKIWHCDLQDFHHGWDLYIGKYRYNYTCLYNYETCKFEDLVIPFSEKKVYKFDSVSDFHDRLFCFFRFGGLLCSLTDYPGTDAVGMSETKGKQYPRTSGFSVKAFVQIL